MFPRITPRKNLPTWLAVLTIAAHAVTAETNLQTATPCLSLATELPITIQYRVQRSASTDPAPRAYLAPTIRPITWTPSGVRTFGDLGIWTYTREKSGHWNADFAFPLQTHHPTHAESRYRLRDSAQGTQIQPHDKTDAQAEPYQPPDEFVAALAEAAIPFLFTIPEDEHQPHTRQNLTQFLTNPHTSQAHPTERGTQIEAYLPQTQSTIRIETDPQGILLRIETTSTRSRHDGPVHTELIQIHETRIIEQTQMPWRFTRTVYQGASAWETLEYEILEATPLDRPLEQASMN